MHDFGENLETKIVMAEARDRRFLSKTVETKAAEDLLPSPSGRRVYFRRICVVKLKNGRGITYRLLC